MHYKANGTYASDVGSLRPPSDWLDLADTPDAVVGTSEDGSEFWIYCTLPEAVLGVAGRDGGDVLWYYGSRTEIPLGGIDVADRRHPTDDQAPYGW